MTTAHKAHFRRLYGPHYELMVTWEKAGWISVVLQPFSDGGRSHFFGVSLALGRLVGRKTSIFSLHTLSWSLFSFF